MKFSFASLKRTATGALACGALLLAGTGLEAVAQHEHKEHQKTEKRDLREHQRTERRTVGNSRTLRQHQKAEKRALKQHQRTERLDHRSDHRRHRRAGYYSNNGRRMYRVKRPSWARGRSR
ncbi:MAG: hypothetical protein LC747_04705 [Acidobacteria bacterium]|nr:hypothetical protein [Acidobacteriota bacterium]